MSRTDLYGFESCVDAMSTGTVDGIRNKRASDVAIRGSRLVPSPRYFAKLLTIDRSATRAWQASCATAAASRADETNHVVFGPAKPFMPVVFGVSGLPVDINCVLAPGVRQESELR